MPAPAEFTATIDAMPLLERQAFLARVEQIESPAQRYVIAFHLLRGDASAATFAASLPSSIFSQHDDAIRISFLTGALHNGIDARRPPERSGQKA